MNIVSSGILWFLIAISFQITNGETQHNKDYIIVMRDGATSQQMNRAMRAMHLMSVPIDSEGVAAQSANPLKQTDQLIKTITGPMSEDAVTMVSGLCHNLNS